MHQKLCTNCLYVILLSLLASCANTKYLPEGSSLYAGPDVHIKDSTISKSKRKALEKELETYVRPRENKKILGLKFKLWAWNVIGAPKKKKGIRNWLRDKVGEPPVLGDNLRMESSSLVLENQLFNRGYFKARSDAEKEIKNKRAKATFEITLGPQYKYRTIEYELIDTQALSKDIVAERQQSLLKEGAPYSLEILKLERERIGRAMNNKGYYFFNQDYLLALMDTAVSNRHEVDIRMIQNSQKMPKAALEKYKINNVFIYPNYSVQNASNEQQVSKADTLIDEGLQIIDPKKSVRPIVFKEAIRFKKDDYYSLSLQNRSLNRLVGTGMFKFIKNDYKVVADPSKITGSFFDIAYNTLLQRGLVTTQDPRLDVTYLLTQYPKKIINLETNVYTLNDTRAGSRLNLTWRNRNLFKGGEQLSIKLTGGLEMQFGGQLKRPNAYTIGGAANLDIPRFLVPFVKLKPNFRFLPKTIIKANYNFINMAKVYRIHSAGLSFGYVWKEDERKEHTLFPINFTYVKTDTLQSSSLINAQNIVYNGLIIGPTYEFTYNTKLGGVHKSDVYFNGSVDMSGVLIGAIQGADYTKGIKKVLKNPYAQYIKVQSDFRYYRHFSKKQTLASRVYAGIGVPYGNSSMLPNIKQLFSGGISSVRGFNARMLGPGTYNEQYLNNSRTYLELLGDLKLEANLEYRQFISGYFSGAAFVDMGNVWLFRENPNFPGGQITKDFLHQVAVSGGLGLRADFKVLLVRFDVGVPFRKPWLPKGQRWVFNKMNPLSSTWRKDNIVYGFAIGLPF